MRTDYTLEESKKKFCPIIGKSCKAIDCFFFEYSHEELIDIYDSKKPLNDPTTEWKELFTCGLKFKNFKNKNEEY